MELLKEEKEEVTEVLSKFEESLSTLESILSPIFQGKSGILNNLNEYEKAKLNIVIAYSINSLFYVYLKSQGIDPNEHPVKQELERVKLYVKKIREITEKEKQDKATLRLNVDAAQRFITHALAPNQEAERSVEPQSNTTPPSRNKKNTMNSQEPHEDQSKRKKSKK